MTPDHKTVRESLVKLRKAKVMSDFHYGDKSFRDILDEALGTVREVVDILRGIQGGGVSEKLEFESGRARIEHKKWTRTDMQEQAGKALALLGEEGNKG